MAPSERVRHPSKIEMPPGSDEGNWPWTNPRSEHKRRSPKSGLKTRHVKARAEGPGIPICIASPAGAKQIFAKPTPKTIRQPRSTYFVGLALNSADFPFGMLKLRHESPA